MKDLKHEVKLTLCFKTLGGHPGDMTMSWVQLCIKAELKKQINKVGLPGQPKLK